VHCTRCGRPICPDCMIPAPVGYQCPECVAEARKAFRQGPTQTLRSVRRRTTMTGATLAVLIAVFLLQLIRGQGVGLGMTGNIDPLLREGAIVPPLIASGEYYRLFTAMFLHFSVIHLLMNAWALWIFGQFVETSMGRVAFAVVFLVGGFVGSVASYVFGPVQQIGAGASGAIVALFGAFIAYNLRRRDSAMSRAALQSAVILILLNAFITLGIRGIDWRAHLGGLVGGFVVGGILDWAGPRPSRRTAAIAGVIGVVAGGIAIALARTEQIKSLLGIA